MFDSTRQFWIVASALGRLVVAGRGMTRVTWPLIGWTDLYQTLNELLNLGKDYDEDWSNVASVMGAGNQAVRGLTPVHMSLMCQSAKCLLENLSANYKHFLTEQVSKLNSDENRLAKVVELFLDRSGDFMKRDGRLITPLHYLALGTIFVPCPRRF